MRKILFGIVFIILILVFVNSVFASTITNRNYTWIDYTYNATTTMIKFNPQWGDEQIQNLTNQNWSGRIHNYIEYSCENSSDIELAFTIVLNKLTTCMLSGQNITAELLDCKEKASYESNFTACMGNLSLKDVVISDKEDEKSVLNTSWQKKYDGLNNQKFWFMIFTIAGGLYFLYDFIIVKKGRINLKREERTNFPKEGAF